MTTDRVATLFPPDFPAGRPEAELYAVGTRIPAFGGVHLDDLGRLVVAVTDSARTPAVLSEIETFKQYFMDSRRMSDLDVVIRVVDYGYRDLTIWSRAASKTLLSERGVNWVDFDEMRNRVVLGVDNMSMAPRLRSIVSEWIPGSALETRVSGSSVSDVGLPEKSFLPALDHSLRDYFNPVPGGVGVTHVDGDGMRRPCTFGFVARHGSSTGPFGYVVNSHCSPTVGDEDDEALAQLSQSYPVGYEVTDYRDKCGQDCMWADATWNRFASGRSGQLATIARTADSSSTAGSVSIAASPSRLDIDGQVNAPIQNEIVQKIGRDSGWTYGPVEHTCVDITRDHDGDVEFRCQDIATYGREPGDSGAPVFIDTDESNVILLIGIHHGRNDSNGNAHFSSMGNIRTQLGLAGSQTLFVGPSVDDN